MGKRKKDSLLARSRILFDAAAIAVHARFGSGGFRQKDLRFLLDLFSNWIESAQDGPFLAVQNTQIARYLDDLVTEGFAKRSTSQSHPRYWVTRVGLLECLSKIVSRRRWWPIEEFFFVLCFIKSYHQRIEALIQQEGTLFPPTLKLEIHHLLDPRQFIESQITLLDREIEKLNIRITHGQDTSRLSGTFIQKGANVEEVIQEVQAQFPYQLSNQKPLADLYRETPQENWLWEMESGSRMRVEVIFLPLREMLLRCRELVCSMR